IENAAHPGDIAGVVGRISPVGEQGEDERRTAIAECGLARSYLSGSAAEIGELDDGFRGRNGRGGLYELIYRAVMERREIARLGVVATAMRKVGIGHGLQIQE